MIGALGGRTLAVLEGWITGRPGLVVLAFLLVTAGFAGGLGELELEEGSEAFLEDVPAQDALDAIDEEFEPPFEADGGSTQLIHRGENVVHRDGLIRLLEFQRSLERTDAYRVEGGSSAAAAVARTIDPEAATTDEQLAALEGATDAEVRTAVRETAEEQPGFAASLSEDANERTPYASATIATVEHEDGVDLQDVQPEIREATERADVEIVVFGGGIVENEFVDVIEDSLAIVVPVVIVLILVFLIVAYRDPFDLVLGLVALIMAVVWTFGFTGLAGIPFTDMMIAVPPLLLAIGIDFGIHAINRYREERVAGADIEAGMAGATDQLLVAFFIVTGTTVIGFGANVTSELGPIADFGFVATMGILFTFLIFGIFLPAAKVGLDRFRRRYGLPTFSTEPLGSEESTLGRLLPVGVHLASRAPVAMLVLALVVTAGAGAYGTTVDTTFDDEDFLPPEELPDYAERMPGPLAPAEYTATATINYLERTFEAGEDDEVTIYLEGPIREDWALESIERAGENPPETFVTGSGGVADAEGLADVIRTEADRNPEFGRLVAANDRSGNGLPDRNVGVVYDALLETPSEAAAREYLAEDGRSTRVVYAVEADATGEEVTDDATEFAGSFRFEATATGDIVVFQQVSELIFRSAIVSLALALGATAVFLAAIYRVIEGRASLGVANLVPIVVTVGALAGTMALLDIPFNALTATALSITIGVGVAYSVHVTHRFIDEYDVRGDAEESLLVTLRGTGGALTGSMLTTLGGAGSLVLAITPILGQFGLLMSISVLYSYLTAVFVLPPTLILWERYAG